MDDDAKRELREALSKIRSAMWSAVLPAGHPRLAGVERDPNLNPRYMLLLWALARGLPFRRVERSHRIQHVPAAGTRSTMLVVEHNLPRADMLARLIDAYMPQWSIAAIAPVHDLRGRTTPAMMLATQWLAEPAGAIEPPAPRPKAPRWTEDQITRRRSVVRV